MARKFPNMPKPAGPNMLQKMQQEMMEFQEELEQREFTASSGGGMVTAKVSGRRELTGIEIKPDAVDPDDVEMLQDLIIAAVASAMEQVEKASAEGMDKFKGALNIPGLF